MEDKIDQEQTLQQEHSKLLKFLNECYESSNLNNIRHDRPNLYL